MAGLAIDKSTHELVRALEEARTAFFVSDYYASTIRRTGLFLDQVLRLSCEDVGRGPFDRTMDATHDWLERRLTAARRAAAETMASGYIYKRDITQSIEEMQGKILKALEAQGQLLSTVKKTPRPLDQACHHDFTRAGR